LQDGFDDAHAGNAGEVADHLGELEVHLLEGLVPPLQVPPGVRDQVGPVALVGAPDPDPLLGPEGGREESQAMQPLDPLAVMDIRLGAVGGALHLARVDQQYLETCAL
jgi:hypothetical protein